MALSIKTEEADRLARAKLTGQTITQAVTTALRERLAREAVRFFGLDAECHGRTVF